MDYNVSRGYQPKCCDACPYAKECVHEKNMVLTVTGRKSIVRLDVESKYVSIEAAYAYLQQALYDSVFSNDENIHLIRAQTSLGKTQAFVELAKNKEGRKALLIAVPLIDLKEEIAERLSSGGGEQIPSWKQVDLPLDLREEVDALYKAGYYKDGNCFYGNTCISKTKCCLNPFQIFFLIISYTSVSSANRWNCSNPFIIAKSILCDTKFICNFIDCQNNTSQSI